MIMKFEFSNDAQVYQYFDEFNATKSSIKRDVEYLKEWMKQEPHLPSIDDEDWLTNFLLRCKNNVEKTKKLIDTYFTARANMPEIFLNRGPEYRDTIEELRKFAYFFAVPKLTPEGERVMIFYIRDHGNSDMPNPMSLMKAAQMVFDVSLKTDKVKGVTMIYDFENISLAFFKTFFTALRIALAIQSKINPIRYNKIYVLNVPFYAQTIVSFATNFIKKQTDKLVIWSKEIEELSTVLPKDCLPKEYGGVLPSIGDVFDIYYDYAKQYYDWFGEQDDIKADLKQKIEDVPTRETMQSMHGTFKKICID